MLKLTLPIFAVMCPLYTLAESCCNKLPKRTAQRSSMAQEETQPSVDAQEISQLPTMIKLSGASFQMGGVGHFAKPDEFPLHQVTLSTFYISETPITNAQFEHFISKSSYVTTAEKKPDLEELMAQLPPGTPPLDESLLQPSSLVFFQPPKTNQPLNYLNWWRWENGANWKHPQGPKSSLSEKADHPVVQVSWFDAEAYAQWLGADLPTEAQFEYAARGGLKAKQFVHGEQFDNDRHQLINIWTGQFPFTNTETDGWLRTNPVKAYPPNGFGLYDMSGNVWEWCRDWYDFNYYAAVRNGVKDPLGPEKPFDPNEPTVPKRVTRGGSFLCNDSYCSGYRPSARMKTSPDTSLEHTGFRIVMTEAQYQAFLKKQQPTD